MEKIIVTGSCGFIGMHTCLSLVKNKNNKVLGLDNLTNYYDVELKKKRNNLLKNKKNYKFIKVDISNKNKIFNIFKKFKPNYVIHLAAQAGVRYSFVNPYAYKTSNIDSFLNILEASRIFRVKHLTYASSSSVYGKNLKIPYSEKNHVNYPVSFYSATKRANELMAHVYSSSYNLPSTGLRFFTVYGPWGRPDMAYYIFAEALLKNKVVNLHDNGKMLRDFTYIDDAVKIINKVYRKKPHIFGIDKKKNDSQNKLTSNHLILNVGNNKPVYVKSLVKCLEIEFKKKLKFKSIPIQRGELNKTYASTSLLKKYTGFAPNTDISNGIHNFVKWFKDYNRL
tara:strand:- start:38571 stop:39584 length:1014 start_codon:yes stop_codon:yes gene_type:complete